MKTTNFINKRNLISTFVKIFAFALLFISTGNLFAEHVYKLPDERRELVNDGGIDSYIAAEVREREIVFKGDEVWCELMSGVRTNLYVTLIFSKTDFEKYYEIKDNMSIEALVTDLRKEDNNAPSGGITTYYLNCVPYGDPLVNSVSSGEPKIFQIFDIVPEADFDTSFLRDIDKQKNPYPEDSIFQIGDIPVIDGSSIIYKFICTYWGNSSDSDTKKIFHDLLYIKTDQQNKIKVAYHYTQEWTDSPSLDLFYTVGSNIKLNENIKIKDLEMRNDWGEYLEEDAILDNIFFAVEQF